MQTLLEPIAEKRQFMEWMAGAGLKVSSVCDNCTTTEIVQSLTAIVNGVVFSRDLTLDETKDVMEIHLHALETCQSDVIPTLCQILLTYVRFSDDRIDFARARRWSRFVTDVVMKRCGTRVANRNAPQYEEAAELIATLGDVDDKDVGVLTLLPGFGVSLRQTTGRNVRDLLHMTGQLANVKPNGLGAFFTKWKKTFTDEEIITAMVDNQEELHEVIVGNLPMVIGWLGHPTEDIRRNAADLLALVARRDSKLVLESFMRRLTVTEPVSCEFLKMLLELLIEQDHPRNKHLQGLQRQPPSPESSAIHGYFGDPGPATGALRHCYQALRNRAQLCDLLPKFFDQFRALGNANFENLLNDTEFRELARIVGESQFSQFAEQLLEILVRRQGLVEHDLLMDLMFGACQVPYLQKTLAQLEKVILVPADIDRLQTCVSELLVKSPSHYALLQKVLPKAINLAESLNEENWTESLRLDDEKVTHFQGNTQVDQSASFLVIDYLAVCAVKNPQYHNAFLELATQMATNRQIAGTIMRISMRIRNGGAANQIAADLSALCNEVLEMGKQMAPATIRRLLAYLRQRAVGATWRDWFWKTLLGAAPLQWLQRLSDVFQKELEQIDVDISLVRRTGRAVNGTQGSDTGQAICRAVIIVKAWREAKSEMAGEIQRQVLDWLKMGQDEDARCLAQLVGT
jgi:hypothetical protein